MNKGLIILAVMCTFAVFSQTSEKYNSHYENYYRAEQLFEKEQYGAARYEFRVFQDAFNKLNNPMQVKAAYYEAISALEMYNNDAVRLLQEFNVNYPESIYKQAIYFKLGKESYRKKKYDDALGFFNKLSPQDIEPEEKSELFFKKGYANFKEKSFEKARNAFYEVKDGESQYAAPALYYYSHIAYQNKKYQLALDGFLKLEEDPKFGTVVPYYIAQIYYLQKKYQEVTRYATKLLDNESIVNENDINHLIGDAFYRTRKYDEAVPYLQEYYKVTETTRDEDYCLGYAYFKSGAYDKAIRVFDKVKKVEDRLGQVAYYHIGESLLMLDNKVSARSAFEGAAFIDMDPVVQEDALYNYAILSYKLDINPYDEAVEAFEMYLKNYPDSDRKEDVYQYLVNVYMNTNNYKKALASLDKLPNKDVRLKTAYQLIAFNQGVGLFQTSDFLGAIASFDLVKRYPIDQALSGKALYWTADANYRLNNYDKAIKQYQAFVLSKSTLFPGLHQEAQYNIGYAYLKKENKRKSIEAFRSFVQARPTNKNKEADALMRIGEGYYVLRENEQAVKHYKQALELKSGNEDQALFYMGKTYGYMSQPEKKIKHLLDIVNNYKGSKYLKISIHEIAESYNSAGDLLNALRYYNKIVYDYPSSVLVVSSKVNIADIYFKQRDYAKSEAEYNGILTQFGSQGDVCEKAVRGLIDIYTAQGQPERVEVLASQYECANFTTIEKEDLYYMPAMEKYEDSSYQESVILFEKYLKKFSAGRYNVEVKNYLANSHYTLGNLDEAIAIYRESLNGPDNGFTELATSRVSHYLYNERRYGEVISYYEKLELVSSTPEVIFNAKTGLMRSYFLTEKWRQASVYAASLLKNSQINNAVKLEAYYAQGVADYHTKNYDAAKVSLAWVIKNTTTIKAAEARYTLADIFFNQNFYDEAEDEVTALIKQRPAYNYWIARGLILSSKVLIVKDDLFQAEQNLKSVIDHYPIPDDGVLDEANELWNELMQLKDQPKNLTPETNPIIEINDEEGN
ncbi:MAG: tetratricopeptide repeat protein [Crocinitomicaceae bacterium]|jgi:tetratricopeptide (TPR) repeat protein